MPNIGTFASPISRMSSLTRREEVTVPSFPVPVTKTATPPGLVAPAIPAMKVAVCFPPAPIRIVPDSPATPEVPMRAGRDLLWDEFLSRAAGQSGNHVPMESNEPAFILATSGTTATPKLAVHTHGGYQVHIASMARWCFGLSSEDVWWSTSDIGWIVGHSYIVYAPLLAGCTTLAYEGAIDYPRPDTLWKIAEEFGVTGIFTSPTAVRLLMRYGEEPARGADLSRLRKVFCAGEVLNAPAWDWLQNRILGGRVPVIDHMWQTETAGPVFGNPYGIAMLPIKPGSATIPLPGIDCAVVTPEGEPCGPGEKGIMVIRRPFPGLTPSLWGEPERYRSDYWDRIPGVYYTGDSAHVDDDGYVWFAGRADEIIKIAAHRVGTIEVETACLQHPSVAEAGVTGRPFPARRPPHRRARRSSSPRTSPCHRGAAAPRASQPDRAQRRPALGERGMERLDGVGRGRYGHGI